MLSSVKKEVNTGCHFSVTRKIFHSLILARWYKSAINESLINEVYSDKEKISGLEEDTSYSDEIYDQYIEAMRKGVFNFIREDEDHHSGDIIPRKYFSGGILASAIKDRLTVVQSRKDMDTNDVLGRGHKCYLVNVRFDIDDRDGSGVDIGKVKPESVAGIDFTQNEIDISKHDIPYTYSLDSDLKKKLLSDKFSGLIAKIENIVPFKSVDEILE